ncbi:MAG TPA: glycosyltransferase family 4 protein [Gemmatimonadales bacterium]|nr:glycosyltransferase family 4 protein [Gemmatimonadales bacterium]
MSRPYRIAMVAACPLPCPRGTPIRIHRMAEALARRGHDVHVVTYHLGVGGEALPFTVHRTPGVPGYRSLSPGPSCGKLLVMDPMLVLALRRLLAAMPFDVIHAHHYEGLLVARCARGHRQVPIVYDAHTLLETELPYYALGVPDRLKRSVGRLLDRLLPGRADHVIAVSEKIRTMLVDSGATPDGRVSVVPNGVELDAFTMAVEHHSVARRAEPRAVRHGPELIFTGNLAPYQRIDLLVRSFRTVVDARDDARLLVVGSASLEQYDQLASALGVRDGIATVPSDFRAIPGQLAAADVALNPRTHCAGVPQKLLNYMAAGRPIVSFAGSGAVLEHGRTGWLVPDGDTAAFGRAVLHLLDEPALAESLGAAARRHVADNYSWDRTGANVEAVYQRMLHDGGG